MSGYAISAEQSQALGRVLSRLATQMEAEALLISDIGGNILASVIRREDESFQTIAALAAGSFSATRELARMIGEPEFLSAFHRGKESSIYLQGLASQFLILAIVQQKTAQGLVKLCVDRVILQLEAILTATRGQSLADLAAEAELELDMGQNVFEDDEEEEEEDTPVQHP